MSGHRTCRAVSCRNPYDANAGVNSDRIDHGQFLCRDCRDRLENDLRNLPELYNDYGKGSGSAGPRVIRKAPGNNADVKVMSPVAAEIRSVFRSVLSSWAGLELARFLNRHVEWLIRHPAAGDLADEIRDIARAARKITRGDPHPPGSCAPPLPVTHGRSLGGTGSPVRCGPGRGNMNRECAR
jgi:hypothetical protein